MKTELLQSDHSVMCIDGSLNVDDPFAYNDGPNLYEFVGSNPVNLLDPLGLQATQPEPPDRYDEKEKMIGVMRGLGDPGGDCDINAQRLKKALQAAGPWKHWDIVTVEGKQKDGVNGLFGGHHNVVVATPSESGYGDPFVLDTWLFQTYVPWDSWADQWGPSTGHEKDKYDDLQNGKYGGGMVPGGGNQSTPPASASPPRSGGGGPGIPMPYPGGKVNF